MRGPSASRAAASRCRLAGLALILSLSPALPSFSEIPAPPASAEGTPPPTEEETPESPSTAAASPATAEDEAAEPPPATSDDLGALEAGPATPPPSEPADQAFDVQSQLDAGSGVRVNTICTNCNAASLTMNGLSGPRVPMTWDGLPTIGGLANVYLLKQFPSVLIGHSDVRRGPGSVLTGAAAVGGSIDFHSAPRDRRRAFLHAEVGDWGWRSLRAAGGDRWGPFGALVAVQGARENQVDANRDGYAEVAEFERLTAHGLFDFHLNDHQVVTLDSLVYGEDQADGPGAPNDPDNIGGYLDEDAYFNLHQHGLTWRLERPSGLQVSVSGRKSRRAHQQWAPLDVFDPRPRRTFWIDDEQSLYRAEVERPLGTAGYLTAGAGYDRMRLAVTMPNDNLQPYFIGDGLEHWEGYAQYDRSAGARWDWSVGLRHDRFTVFGKTHAQRRQDPIVVAIADEVTHSFFLPRGQVHFRPNDQVILGLAVGRGAIGPRPVFEATCCGAAYQRNIGLAPERSLSVQHAIEVHPTPNMRLTTTLFWTDFEDMHERVVYETSSYIPKYSNVAIPEATIRGVDLVHDMRFKDNLINVGWTYTYTDAYDVSGTWVTTTEPFTGNIRVDQVTQPGTWLPYKPRNAASAYVRYDDARRGLSVGLDVRHTGGLRHFLTEVHRGANEPWEFVRSTPFTTVDLKGEKRIGRGGWSIQAGVNNVTDYVQADLGNAWRCYDWGPIQGRFVFAGAKFNL